MARGLGRWEGQSGFIAGDLLICLGGRVTTTMRNRSGRVVPASLERFVVLLCVSEITVGNAAKLGISKCSRELDPGASEAQGWLFSSKGKVGVVTVLVGGAEKVLRTV